jgi:hypothetical protein
MKNNQAVINLQGSTELRKLKERGLLDGIFSTEIITSFYPSLNLSSSHNLSIGNIVNSCVNVHEIEPFHFQWKVASISSGK